MLCIESFCQYSFCRPFLHFVAWGVALAAGRDLRHRPRLIIRVVFYRSRVVDWGIRCRGRPPSNLPLDFAGPEILLVESRKRRPLNEAGLFCESKTWSSLSLRCGWSGAIGNGRVPKCRVKRGVCGKWQRRQQLCAVVLPFRWVTYS